MIAIRSVSSTPITTLEDWLREAPPAAGLAHWMDLRSAKEMARRWLPGEVPAEVVSLLASSPATRTFIAAEACPELETRLDSFGGRHRRHDLVVTGSATLQSGDTLLSVEGKADESFGPKLTAIRVTEGSNRHLRARALTLAVLGCLPAHVPSVRYQLIHAAAGGLIEAKSRGASRAVLIVHEFRSRALSKGKLAQNHADLTQFVRHLAKAPTLYVESGALIGPFRVPGNAYVPATIDLFIGKAVVELN